MRWPIKPRNNQDIDIETWDKEIVREEQQVSKQTDEKPVTEIMQFHATMRENEMRPENNPRESNQYKQVIKK